MTEDTEREIMERLARLEALMKHAVENDTAKFRILDDLRKDIGGFNLALALLTRRVDDHDERLAEVETTLRGNGKQGLIAAAADHERRLQGLETTLKRTVRVAVWAIGLIVAPIFTGLGIFLAAHLGLR